MIKKSFNLLFWGSIIAFAAYHISKHFDSFEIANVYLQEEKYEEADIAISKYNAGSHNTIKTVNGYILQSEISNRLDRLYLAKELANHALEISQSNHHLKAICLSQNALQKSQLLIGDLQDVEKPLLECLSYFKSQQNDVDLLNTLSNLVHYYLLTNNNNIHIYFNEAQKIIAKKDSLSYLLVDMYTYHMLYYKKDNQSILAKQMLDNAIFLQKKHFPEQTNKLAYLHILNALNMIGDNNLNALSVIEQYTQNTQLQFTISMKIHTLIIMGKIYENLDDSTTSLQFSLKALALLHTFPTKEVHAVEASIIYQSLLNNYHLTGNVDDYSKVYKEANIVLHKFPTLQNKLINSIY